MIYRLFFALIVQILNFSFLRLVIVFLYRVYDSSNLFLVIMIIVNGIFYFLVLLKLDFLFLSLSFIYFFGCDIFSFKNFSLLFLSVIYFAQAHT